MNPEDLKIGLEVTYVPRHAWAEDGHKDREVGNIKSWNDRFVFVDYGTGTAKATPLENLQKGDKTFYCHNENDSVLDGAFGRCGHVCNDCNTKNK